MSDLGCENIILPYISQGRRGNPLHETVPLDRDKIEITYGRHRLWLALDQPSRTSRLS